MGIEPAGQLHPWDVSPQEAIAIQEDLRAAIVVEDRFDPLRSLAGVDVGFEQDGNVTRAAVAVLRYPDLSPLESALVRRPTRFPYVPGLLSFREAPAILAALAQLEAAPDLLLCDGHGLAHPRRFGLACHLGLLLDIPAIGVGKSRLVGEHSEPGEERGARAPLLDGDHAIGCVLRTRTGVRPVYVSVGHRLSLESAVEIVLACAPKFRLPEPIRRAHRLASHK
jgi:deoxyribonuclease V